MHDQTTNGLWTNSRPEPHCVLPATSARDTQAQMVAFAQAALFLPTLAMFQKAIDSGTRPDFPGLPKETLHKFPPNVEATQARHLDNHHKHQQPTPQEDTNLWYLPAIQPQNIVNMDQTGQVPVASSQGNQYFLVNYDFNSNAILLCPIKNRSPVELTKALASIHQTLTDSSCKP